MTTLLFAATDAPFYSTWLTSIWLIGLGVLAGLLLLAAIWGISAGLSMIPAIGRLAEDRRRLLIAGGVVAVAYFFAILIFFVIPSYSSLGELLLRLLVFAPLSYAAGIATIALVSRRTVIELPLALREGPLLPLLVMAVLFACFGIVATFVIPQKPYEILGSLPRLNQTGETVWEYEVAPRKGPNDRDGQALEVSFFVRELRTLEIRSSQPLLLSLEKFSETESAQTLEILADSPMRINRQQAAVSGDEDKEKEFYEQVYVRNDGTKTATVQIKTTTSAEYGEVIIIPITAIALVSIFLLYVLQRSLMPKMSAIALATIKSEMAQPIFVILLLVATGLIIVFVYIPYNTFGEDIKMLKDTGMVLILLIGVFLAVWAASKSVAEEIEGRTALTVLSKPIGRREFLIGKFVGIGWTLAILFVILGTVLVLAVAYKPIYDARESSRLEATWQSCYFEAAQLVPGLVLAFMETVVFAAISVAISTRLSMLPNFLICMAVYLLGHLTPLMVQSSVAVEAFEPVVFIGQLTATVFPVLDHFNVQAAVAGGTRVPLDYLGWSFLYCLIYSTIAMLLALVFFEDRDLT